MVSLCMYIRYDEYMCGTDDFDKLCSWLEVSQIIRIIIILKMLWLFDAAY